MLSYKGITFCIRSDCSNLDCFRHDYHLNGVRPDIQTSVANFDNCRIYIKKGLKNGRSTSTTSRI